MEVGIFTWMDLLDGCFATSSSHWSYSKWIASFGRILFALVEPKALDGCFATSSSQLPYSKPCAAVPAAWLFCFSHPYKSELLTSAQNKKARTVRAGFVTLYLLGFQNFTCMRI